MGWPLVPLGELVSHRKEFITIDPEATYLRCRVQVSARGVVLRDRISGGEIKTRRQQVCRAEEFLIAEIDAKMGGYGIVPHELDGAIVSSHYFLYEIDQRRLMPSFLGWYCRTPDFLNQVNARGSTNYAAIRAGDVLSYRFPLPPLDEQRRITSRLNEITALVEERRRTISLVESESQALLSKAFREVIREVPRRPMSEVAPLVRRPVDVDPDGGYPELGVRSFGRGTFHKPVLSGMEVGSKKLFSIREGDLLFNIVFAWEGAVAIAQSEDDQRVGSHRFLTCVPNPELITGEFLHYYFLTTEGLQRLGDASPGGAGRNRTLGLKKLAAIEVPVPCMPVQSWFNRIRQQVRQIGSMHTSIILDAGSIIPALLHRAFKQQVENFASRTTK